MEELVMPRKRFSAEEIVNKLREANVLLSQGQTIVQVCKQIGITDQTYYRWRKEYGGLKTDQVKRLKKLEREKSVVQGNVPEEQSKAGEEERTGQGGSEPEHQPPGPARGRGGHSARDPAPVDPPGNHRQQHRQQRSQHPAMLPLRNLAMSAKKAGHPGSAAPSTACGIGSAECWKSTR
jgi:transposase-like protein